MPSTGNRSQLNDFSAKRLWLAYDSFMLAITWDEQLAGYEAMRYGKRACKHPL